MWQQILVVVASKQARNALGEPEVLIGQATQVTQARQIVALKSRRSPVPGEKKYHLGYPSGRCGGYAGGCGPPVPGGADADADAAAADSFLATFGADSIEGAAIGAADFCGGARGEVFVSIVGGALKGMPDLAMGWSTASAGRAGGSFLGDPAELFGVGGGLGFGDATGDAPVPVLLMTGLGNCGGFFGAIMVPCSLVLGLMKAPTDSLMICATPPDPDATSEEVAALDSALAFETISIEAAGSPVRSFSSALLGSSKISRSICLCFSSSLRS